MKYIYKYANLVSAFVLFIFAVVTCIVGDPIDPLFLFVVSTGYFVIAALDLVITPRMSHDRT